MVTVYEGSALKHLAQVRPDYPTDMRFGQDHGPEAEGSSRQGAGRTAATRESKANTPRAATRHSQPGERSERTTCGFCGKAFVEDRSQATCQACPLSKACGLMRCPHCGYENAKEPGWLSRIKEWIG